ncbi:MAG TPA: enoyl-CoA hydratase [Thermoanaerobaculia bacterium]|nr:enoyl-CoA hydratase [Thermoanaerobaculia bacterium]
MPESRTRVALTWVDGGEGRVAWLEVSEPRRLNVLDTPAIDDLSGVVDQLGLVGVAGGLRAVVLRGGGERAFIGGADLRELSRLDERSAREFITRLHELCRALRALPVPVIASIRGYCLGAGLEVAASCDLRVAATDASFGMPEVLVGIPSVIEAALLPQLVGWGRAREMMLTGRMYDASEALAMGLVEEVVPAESLEAAVTRRLEWIQRASPEALAAQKDLFLVWERGSLEEAIEAGIDAFAASYRTSDGRARMQAFLARKT